MSQVCIETGLTWFRRWDKKVKESNTDIDIFSLPSQLLQKCGSGVWGIGHNRLPRLSCIYFVVDKNESIIYYIGQAKDLKRRFQNHLSKKRCFWELGCTVFWLIRDYSPEYKNDPLEAAFIRKYRPKLNVKIA
jgi:predicted GIY-YIG superfamily endonuclease